ncbi:4-hydroxy-tetrahydrodipicolinate reductase [Oceanivirga miroungae]|uniref:4-hydroxy-tetrahydrodipicolinate reductase n=1 Tax=Oceanivirga miroungae TaxID=1130046 RepID=A0A6I8MDI9_9FUSO|nr:4-hydroxy-tetrahydrodipicolinate reductase [Oceanivirga miroungae]VWL85160.1 dihydrodipicolinate reductase [Oceanivirga miroungae]
MRVLILGNGVMSNILKDVVINSSDTFVDMIDTKENIECDLDFDVIIDFSNHLATKKVVDFAIMKNKPLLIATTGQTEDEIKYIEKAKEKLNILKISNTSLGVYVMNEIVKLASSILEDFDVAVEEIHHTRKLDSPSGTALTLIENIKKSNENKEVQVNSLRLSNISGIHKVIFSAEDEILEIKHTAISRKIFALGAIKYARKMLD